MTSPNNHVDKIIDALHDVIKTNVIVGLSYVLREYENTNNIEIALQQAISRLENELRTKPVLAKLRES